MVHLAWQNDSAGKADGFLLHSTLNVLLKVSDVDIALGILYPRGRPRESRRGLNNGKTNERRNIHINKKKGYTLCRKNDNKVKKKHIDYTSARIIGIK